MTLHNTLNRITTTIDVRTFLKLGAKEGGRIQELPNFWGYRPIILGTGKATDFKFCRHIHSINRQKSP